MSRHEHRFVVAGDFHIPYHCPVSLKLLKNVLADFRPHEVVINGDFIDAESASVYTKDIREGQDQLHEFEVANDLLDQLMGAATARTSWRYMDGNHEDRLFRVGNIPQEYRRLLDPRVWLRLKKRKMLWYPYDNELGVHKIGDWSVIHGFGHSKHAAAVNASKHGNCIFGHIHREQRFSDYICGRIVTAVSPGCMCTTQAYARKKDKNGQVKGFTIGYKYRSGKCAIKTVRIEGDKVHVLGKGYRL